jgi:hypothetical protein
VHTTAVRIAGACAISAALVLSATGCAGGHQKSDACDKLRKTITDISQQGMKQVSDPNGLAQTYANGANTMREQGKDSGDDKVEKAANDAATALENLGQQVKNLASSGSTSPQMPDVSALTNAGRELDQACSG